MDVSEFDQVGELFERFQACARKGPLAPGAKAEDRLVEEFAPVVRVDPANGEREPMTESVQRHHHGELAFAPQRDTFGPARRDHSR